MSPIFIIIRGAYRAAGARLLELTNRYPLYSQADEANWMLGQIYEKTEHNDIAARYYSRIVKDYPLSPLAGDAKNKLTKFGVPVPPADPAAVARMQKEEASVDRPGIVGRSLGFVRTRPDVSTASHTGAPTMTPAGESGDETLSFGAQPNMTIGAGSPGNTATVETVTPGSSTSLGQPATNSSDDAAPRHHRTHAVQQRFHGFEPPRSPQAPVHQRHRRIRARNPPARKRRASTRFFRSNPAQGKPEISRLAHLLSIRFCPRLASTCPIGQPSSFRHMPSQSLLTHLDQGVTNEGRLWRPRAALDALTRGKPEDGTWQRFW